MFQSNCCLVGHCVPAFTNNNMTKATKHEMQKGSQNNILMHTVGYKSQ